MFFQGSTIVNDYFRCFLEMQPLERLFTTIFNNRGKQSLPTILRPGPEVRVGNMQNYQLPARKAIVVSYSVIIIFIWFVCIYFLLSLSANWLPPLKKMIINDPKMAPNGQRSKVLLKGHKMSYKILNVWNDLKWFSTLQYYPKWSQMVSNGSKWPWIVLNITIRWHHCQHF